MERNIRNQQGTGDDNDSSTEVQTSLTGQLSSSSSTQLNAVNNLANADIIQFLQPSGSSLQLGANLQAMQSQGLNQQMAIDALFPGVMAARTDQIDLVQRLLALQQPQLLASAQNHAATLNNFSSGQTYGRPMWPSSALAQATAERQIQYQQGNSLLASLTANMANAVNIANGVQIGSGPMAPQAGTSSGLPAPSRGHGPKVMYLECDEDNLSQYQCLLRKQIELFEADFDDVQWNAQGRNKAIVQGQVGIRCRHCTRLESWERARGAVYYSATLDGLYQAAQNMAKNHLCKHCKLIPSNTKEQLLELRDSKRRAAGGKAYWADSARVLGVYETQNGLRFR